MRGPYDPFLKEAIGERLRLTRLALGFHTQISIVRALNRPNITAAHWNNWESGRVRMGVDYALVLKHQFGLSLDWIYQGEKGGLSHKLARALDALEGCQHDPVTTS